MDAAEVWSMYLALNNRDDEPLSQSMEKIIESALKRASDREIDHALRGGRGEKLGLILASRDSIKQWGAAHRIVNPGNAKALAEETGSRPEPARSARHDQVVSLDGASAIQFDRKRMRFVQLDEHGAFLQSGDWQPIDLRQILGAVRARA